MVTASGLFLSSSSVRVIVINQNCPKTGQFLADPQFFKADMPFFSPFFCCRAVFALHNLHIHPSCHVTLTTKMASVSQEYPKALEQPPIRPFSRKG